MAKRSRGLRLGVIVVVIVVALAAGGAAVLAAGRSSGATYRTAVAAKATVTQTMSLVGTVESSNMRILNFPASGQVQSVVVSPGQRVAKGQMLATLNDTSLAEAVTSAEATLASAQASLATDEAAQASGIASTTTSSNTSGTGASSPRPNASTSGMARAQAAIRATQLLLEADLIAMQAALQAATTACQTSEGASAESTSSVSSPEPTAVTRPSSDPVPNSKPSPQPSPSPTTSPPPPGASCNDALQALVGAQTRVVSDVQALGREVVALTAAVTQALHAAAASASQSQSAGTGGGTGPGSGAGTGSGAVQRTVTDQQIASDEASVASAKAQLASAQQSLDAATLTSPIAGAVIQINISAGSFVSPTSPADQIVVVGPGPNVVTVNVDASNVGLVRTGLSASVTPDGTSISIPGHVQSIGLLGSASSSSTTYPVTIALDGPSTSLMLGSNASVSIVLARAVAAVAIPTSSVHTQGSRSYVTILKNGTTTDVPVTVGAIGATTTQILSGVSVGDVVVLAKLAQPLPSANPNPRGLGGGGAFIGRPAGSVGGGTGSVGSAGGGTNGGGTNGPTP